MDAERSAASLREKPRSLASSAAFSSAGRSGEVIAFYRAREGGHPVRFGFSGLSWTSLEYWVQLSRIVIPGCASWRRPGIHNHDYAYGFRARAPRAPE